MLIPLPLLRTHFLVCKSFALSALSIEFSGSLVGFAANSDRNNFNRDCNDFKIARNEALRYEPGQLIVVCGEHSQHG